MTQSGKKRKKHDIKGCLAIKIPCLPEGKQGKNY